MDNSNNLAYSSEFNYQKINLADKLTGIVIPSLIDTTTVISTITSPLSFDTWRVFAELGGDIQELSYFDNIGIGARLYSYAQGNDLVIACDESGSSVTVNFYYRIYLQDGS